MLEDFRMKEWNTDPVQCAGFVVFVGRGNVKREIMIKERIRGRKEPVRLKNVRI